MNKSDLIDEVAKVVGTKKAAQEATETVFSAITQALSNQDTVTITGFGTFKVSHRPARKGRHPQTGQELWIKAANVPKFSAGKTLKDAVN